MPQAPKLRCLIIDDEPPARDVLKKHIEAVEALEMTGESSNAVEALSFLQIHPVDLLFLDIEMPHILGTKFLRALKTPPKVIFTTAYRKYALEGFDLNAVDYLLKPISFERFLQAINKVMQTNITVTNNQNPFNVAEQSHPFLYFRTNRKMVKVFLEDILFIESLKDYIRIVTKNKTIVTKQPISSLEEMLPKDGFIRIHRSYIIAIDKIESYNTDSIEIGSKGLPIGRLFRHEVSKALNLSSIKEHTTKQLISPAGNTKKEDPKNQS